MEDHMLPKYETVRYELLRPAQVKALRDKAPIVYIVVGSLEWHGVHNPLGADSLKAHAICCEAALKHGGVVLPPLYLGLFQLDNSTWGPPGWEGYTLGTSQLEVLESAALAIATALVDVGWKVLVGVTGHDWSTQRDVLGRAIALAAAGKDAVGFALMEGELHTPDADIPVSMDHAGAWETSCMMYACPEKVDLEELHNRGFLADDYSEMSKSEGISGKNPLKYASAELGQRIIEGMGELIGARASSMLAGRPGKRELPAARRRTGIDV
jgi:creatinine amidohydrolase